MEDAPAHAGTQSPVGGLFAPRSASRRPFSNPAASAISIVNNTAVDIFHNIAEFAGNAAVAVHGSIGSPTAGPLDDAGRPDGGTAQGAQQFAAADGGVKSFASAASATDSRASRVAGNAVQGAHRDTSAARPAAGGSAGSRAKNSQAPVAASMQTGAGSVASAADQRVSRVDGTAVQGARHITSAAGASADGSAGSVANNPQASAAASVHNGVRSIVAAPGQSASQLAADTVQGAHQDAASAGASAGGSAGSTANDEQAPTAGSVHKGVGSVIAAADQTAIDFAHAAAASAKGHVLAVEQLANRTTSTVKALLPASRAELQQQSDQTQAGEDGLQRELKHQDAALQAQLQQQDAKLRRQEHKARRQAGKIMQQNVTITDLITQVNMNTTNYNGPRVMNGTSGGTGEPALGADHMRAPHASSVQSAALYSSDVGSAREKCVHDWIG